MFREYKKKIVLCVKRYLGSFLIEDSARAKMSDVDFSHSRSRFIITIVRNLV